MKNPSPRSRVFHADGQTDILRTHLKNHRNFVHLNFVLSFNA